MCGNGGRAACSTAKYAKYAKTVLTAEYAEREKGNAEVLNAGAE